MREDLRRMRRMWIMEELLGIRSMRDSKWEVEVVSGLLSFCGEDSSSAAERSSIPSREESEVVGNTEY